MFNYQDCQKNINSVFYVDQIRRVAEDPLLAQVRHDGKQPTTISNEGKRSNCDLGIQCLMKLGWFMVFPEALQHP